MALYKFRIIIIIIIKTDRQIKPTNLSNVDATFITERSSSVACSQVACHMPANHNVFLQGTGIDCRLPATDTLTLA